MAGMSGTTGIAGSGLLTAQARAQYAAMVAMRWRVFLNGLHSIHGILELGATGIAWMFYAFIGLGVGLAWARAATNGAARGLAYSAHPVLGRGLPLVDASGGCGLLSGAVGPGNSVAVSGAPGIVFHAVSDLRLDGLWRRVVQS